MLDAARRGDLSDVAPPPTVLALTVEAAGREEEVATSDRRRHRVIDRRHDLEDQGIEWIRHVILRGEHDRREEGEQTDDQGGGGMEAAHACSVADDPCVRASVMPGATLTAFVDRRRVEQAEQAGAEEAEELGDERPLDGLGARGNRAGARPVRQRSDSDHPDPGGRGGSARPRRVSGQDRACSRRPSTAPSGVRPGS